MIVEGQNQVRPGGRVEPTRTGNGQPEGGPIATDGPRPRQARQADRRDVERLARGRASGSHPATYPAARPAAHPAPHSATGAPDTGPQSSGSNLPAARPAFDHRTAPHAIRRRGRPRRPWRPPPVSISEPFIRRPVATTLLMIGLLLAGIVALHAAPGLRAPAGRLSDHRRLDVSCPARAPRRWRRAVTTPLERQFGQMPSLAQMTSVSSFGSSQVTLQFTLDRNIDAAEQDVQAAINAASNLLPRDAPGAADVQQEQPRRRADPHAQRQLDVAAAHARSTTSPTRSSRRRSRRSPASASSRSTAARSPPCACRSIPPALAGTGLTLEDVRAALVAANVNQPKGNLDGPRQDYTLATERSALERRRRSGRSSSPTRTARRCASSTSPTSIDGVENAQLAGWAGRPARDHPQRPAPARRERHRGRRPREGAPAAARARRSRRGSTSTILERPHRDGARVGRGRRVHARPHDRPRRRCVIFVFLRQRARDGHPERRRAALARRHVRRDVPARLQPEQPLADGAHDRDRLRRRRRDRDDREHRALHRGGREAVRGRAQGREADRLHDRVAHGVARRGAHSAPLHERHHRAPLPRVRGHARRRHRRLGAAVAHAHGDDVRAPPEARAEAREARAALHAVRARRSTAMLAFYDRGAQVGPAPPARRRCSSTIATVVLTGASRGRRAEGILPAAGHRPRSSASRRRRPTCRSRG